MTDRIDDYLDDMSDRLEGPPSERRHMLSETEMHLREAADAYERDGLNVSESQSAAIASFGSSSDIARASNRRDRGGMIRAFLDAAARLCVYGFAAIGVAALLARGLALITSTQWVYGAPPGYRFPAAQCAHWLSVQPAATDCRTAAALESSDDSFFFVLAAAIIGLAVAAVVLGGARLLSRPLHTAPRLPRNVIAAIGATAFLGAGGVLVAAGVTDGMARGIWGQGVLYAYGTVALIFGVVFLVRFLMTVRPVPVPTAA